MSSVIYKYPISIHQRTTLLLSTNAEILTAQMQQGTLCVWALVDPDMPTEKRHIAVFGTGEAPLDGYPHYYIGTVQEEYRYGDEYSRSLVWHVFEVGE